MNRQHLGINPSCIPLLVPLYSRFLLFAPLIQSKPLAQPWKRKAWRVCERASTGKPAALTGATNTAWLPHGHGVCTCFERRSPVVAPQGPQHHHSSVPHHRGRRAAQGPSRRREGARRYCAPVAAFTSSFICSSSSRNACLLLIRQRARAGIAGRQAWGGCLGGGFAPWSSARPAGVEQQTGSFPPPRRVDCRAARRRRANAACNSSRAPSQASPT